MRYDYVNWSTLNIIYQSNHMALYSVYKRNSYVFWPCTVNFSSKLYLINHISVTQLNFIIFIAVPNTPVTLYGDYPATSLRSQILKFFTKKQWIQWCHGSIGRLQYALDPLITLSLRPYASLCVPTSQYEHQCALNASLCIPTSQYEHQCALNASLCIPTSQYEHQCALNASLCVPMRPHFPVWTSVPSQCDQVALSMFVIWL